MWVIDGLSLERLDESYQELREKIILQDQLVGTYLIILVNKIDLISQDDQTTVEQRIKYKLQLDKELNEDKFTIQLVSGITGEGLNKALEWMISKEI